MSDRLSPEREVELRRIFLAGHGGAPTREQALELFRELDGLRGDVEEAEQGRATAERERDELQRLLSDMRRALKG